MVSRLACSMIHTYVRRITRRVTRLVILDQPVGRRRPPSRCSDCFDWISRETPAHILACRSSEPPGEDLLMQEE